MKEQSGLAASKKLMQNYLSELLTEDPDDVLPQSIPVAEEKPAAPVIEVDKLNKLLQQTSAAKVLTDDFNTVTTVKSESKKVEIPEKTQENNSIATTTEIKTKKSSGEISLKVETDYHQGRFQAMFFKVAGLTIAVPLIELGGIYNVEKTTTLMGKPDWFKGVMVQRENQINVVDTALWVMPEKCTQELKDSLNYQYIIMLSDSSWGLMAEHLVDTVTLAPEDVKWIEQSSKRPWLAGLVKERMCALLNVEALIKLLDKGANINQR
ncbi:chemotaxis protein CheW [Thalassotalea piscium]